jgi:3'-phosphoadenosine 5'-phosphosulfate sulfotransferase (PAPS reductase)/FAD synthetase
MAPFFSMNKPVAILQKVRQETDSLILFTSLTGKDSILLTYYAAQIFTRVVCVYMYIVKDLRHVLKYQAYFENRFEHVHYIHVPHYVLASHIKVGFLGMSQDKKQKNYSLAQLNTMVCEKVKIDWTCFGMKQNDSMNRRLQLRGYEDNAICRKSKKVYPLSELTNKQVLGLIDINHLPKPIKYNNRPSQGQDIDDIKYLLWLQNYYPADLLKTFEVYPGTRELIYRYEQRKTETPA